MSSNKSQVKVGIVFSYTLIVINTLYGLFLTPYILSHLGEAEYGVYKTISSLSSSLMVLDLGIGGTVMRYVASYRAKKQDNKIPNFIAMNFIQALFLCIVISAISVIVYIGITPVYKSAFTEFQLQRAKELFIVLAINMILHVFENVINGIITGCNNFIFGNGIKLSRLISRVVLLIVLLRFFSNSLVLVLVDLSLTVVTIIVELLFVRFKLNIIIKFSHWDKSVFFDAGKYTLLMFLTTIAAQVNSNLDNVIIGAIRGPDLVTIYSMGLLVFSMYENLSVSISGVMLPTVTNILETDDKYSRTIKLIIKVGRMQFALLGAAVVGFLCVGRDFIQIWLGQGFEDVYVITLVLMIPSLFELCVNVCISILRAKNMLVFRTVVLFVSTIINAFVTILLVKEWSYIGASFGTATSFVIGSLIVMNIYYYKKLGLPMLYIYSRIVSGIWLCLLISGIAIFISSKFLYGNWFAFIINVLIFGVIYLISLLIFGLKKEELDTIPIIKNIRRRIG